jgi:Pin2-interacting protein X1
MSSQGWEEGKGLGKDKQGIKSHIRVRKPREEKSGVGVYEKEKAASDWTVNTHVFDNILKNLNLVLTHYPVKPVFTYAWNLQKNC